jgi:GT2 family glycosyltransferase
VLPIDFIARIGRLATEFESSPVVTAIVPQVVGDNRAISPFKFVAESFPRPFNPGYTGCPSQGTYAINSAAMLRLDALAQVGGYDPLFPLDISDLYLFHRLHLAGKKVYIAGDVVVHHELGLLKKHKRMNMERYRAVLLDECAFWDMYRGPVARLERMIRLAGRVCKDTLNREDRAYRRETLKEFKRRLLTRRARRVDDWRKWAGARMMSQLTLSNGVGRDEPANQ